MTFIILRTLSTPNICTVLRATCISILLFTAMALLYPVSFLVQFELDRERIARELCVQREVAEETRTCHGQCHLTKKLKPFQEDTPQSAIPETTVVTVLPGFTVVTQDHTFIPCIERIAFSRYNAAIAEGHTGIIEQVPRV